MPIKSVVSPRKLRSLSEIVDELFLKMILLFFNFFFGINQTPDYLRLIFSVAIYECVCLPFEVIYSCAHLFMKLHFGLGRFGQVGHALNTG